MTYLLCTAEAGDCAAEAGPLLAHVRPCRLIIYQMPLLALHLFPIKILVPVHICEESCAELHRFLTSELLPQFLVCNQQRPLEGQGCLACATAMLYPLTTRS